MDFSDFTIAELREKRKRANIALEKLMMGKGIAELVDQSGERIKYTATNVGALRNWIAHITAEINRRENGGCPARGAIFFYP